MARIKGRLIAGGFVALMTVVLAGLIMMRHRSEPAFSEGTSKEAALPRLALESHSHGGGAMQAPEDKGGVAIFGGENQGGLPSLVLKGTISGGNTMRYAIIVDTDNDKPYLLKTGDRVNGAMVTRIQRNTVDLSVRGQGITLRTGSVSSGGSSESLLADRSIPPFTREELMERYAEHQERAAEVEHLRKQIVIRAYHTGASPAGVLVSLVEPGSIFDIMGLKQGDIITSVQGKRIDTEDDSMELFECLSSSQEGSLTITRNGRPAVLRYRNGQQ